MMMSKYLQGYLLMLAVLLPVFAGPAWGGQGSVFDQQQQDAGRGLFEENCAACHGYDGVPMLPGTPNFFAGERLDKSDEALLETITKGKDLMPSWDGELDAEQLQQLLKYIRGMAGE